MRRIKFSGTLRNKRPTRPSIDKQEKRTRHLVDFAVPADHTVKMKESEKMDTYLDIAREGKKLWNKVIVLPIVVGALGAVAKGLEKKTG